jgi:hypothetical protein
MGISKSLRKQPLNDAANAFQNFMLKQRQDEQLQQMAPLLKRYKDMISGLYAPKETAPVQETTPGTSPLPEDNKVIVPGTPGNFTAPGTNKLSPEDYYNANKQAGVVMNDLGNQISNFTDVPEEIKQNGLNSLKDYNGSFQPMPKKTKYEKIGDSTYQMTNDEPVDLNKPVYTEPPKTGLKALGDYIGKDNRHHTIVIDPNDKTKEIVGETDVRPLKGNVTNIDNKPDPKANISTGLGELDDNLSQYKYYDGLLNDKTKTLDKDQKNKIEETKASYMGNITGKTTELTSKINDIVPGFEGVLNLLYSKVGNDPKKIDPAVDESLKGKNPDVIRWTKKILHARIF